MKLDISKIDKELFNVKSVNVFNIDCYLIFPKEMGVKWNDDNSIYRSSLWCSKTGKPLSLGWKKFTNIEEQPDFEPIDYNIPIEYIQKLDGSTGLLSKINGNICFRSRQTTDARNLENGYEVDLLIGQYPNLFNNEYINSENYTILCEWTTPNNRIVLKESAEPKLWLTGIVKHEDYSYLSQDLLDELAKDWDIERPKRYKFDSQLEAIKFAENQNEIEGLVLYCNNGQVLKKCKSLHYLKIHKLKSGLESWNNLIDLFISLKYPSYNEFFKYIEKTLDFECAEGLKDKLNKICELWAQVLIIEAGMRVFVSNLNGLVRKEQASIIISTYKDTERTGFVFHLLDGRNFGDKEYKLLLEQCFEKES